jgi:natural product precursor
MKRKKPKKLKLTTNTVRKLSDRELSKVGGGFWTVDCNPTDDGCDNGDGSEGPCDGSLCPTRQHNQVLQRLDRGR